MNRNAFFTLESLGTLAGAVAVTTIIANSVQAAFGYNPSWLALVVAEFVCIGVALISRGADSAIGSTLFVAIINGFLVFATASGITQTIGAATRTPSSGPVIASSADAARPVERTFLTPWP